MRDFSPQRINELVDAFFASWHKGQTACDAMRSAVLSPCSRFWISEEAAMKHIWRVKRYGIKSIRSTTKREMIAEIIRICNGDLSVMNVERAVNSPAPQFYLRPETARRLIQKELKRRRACKRKR